MHLAALRRLQLSVALLATASALLAAGEPRKAAARELTTDRPDATESPFTVEPGHAQLEMDLVAYARDRDGPTLTEEWEGAPLNVRVGVTRNLEAGIFLVPYRRIIESAARAPRTAVSGPGDVTLRGKWNVRGNDGGSLAWGLMADLKLPTASRRLGNRQVEGALTLPVAFDVGAGWGGAAMTAIEVVYTDAGRHRPVWINTLTVGRDLTATVGGFIEVTSAAGDGAHVATLNGGLTRRLSADTQLDCGINVALSRGAPDRLFFVGLSRRY